MTFGAAFERIRDGSRSMWRRSWSDGIEVWAVNPDNGGIYNVPVLAIDGQFAIEPWLPNTGDLFAVDWEIQKTEGIGG